MSATKPIEANTRGYYLLASDKNGFGLSVWWKPDGCGYTTDLDEAGFYSEKEARETESLSRGVVIAVPVDVAWAASFRATRVDSIDTSSKPVDKTAKNRHEEEEG